MASPVVARCRLPIRAFVANHQHVGLHGVDQIILVLQIRFEVLPPLELGGQQVDPQNLLGKVDWVQLIQPKHKCT